MDKVVGVDHPDVIKVSKAVDGADLRVANKVMDNKDRVDTVERPVTKVVMVVKPTVVQLDNQAATAWAMTTHRKVNMDKLPMVVADGVANKDKSPVVKVVHRNQANHLKKENAVNKIKEVKMRIGIAKA